MSKLVTALTLFDQKVPNVEVQSIERVFRNMFAVVTADGLEYRVDIGANSVALYYDDPEW